MVKKGLTYWNRLCQRLGVPVKPGTGIDTLNQHKVQMRRYDFERFFCVSIMADCAGLSSDRPFYLVSGSVNPAKFATQRLTPLSGGYLTFIHKETIMPTTISTSPFQETFFMKHFTKKNDLLWMEWIFPIGAVILCGWAFHFIFSQFKPVFDFAFSNLP